MADRVSLPEHAAGPAPLLVDLDGTLLTTNLLVECLFILLKRNPLRLFLVPVWLVQGRAALQRHLAEEAAPDIQTLPYRPEVLADLVQAKQRGVPLVLVSAGDKGLALAVARHLGLFTAVVAGDGGREPTGQSGPATRDRLIGKVGPQAFEGAGIPANDCAVREATGKAVVVGPPPAGPAGRGAVERLSRPRPAGLRAYLKALRPYQWAKNILVFVPLVAAHSVFDADLLGHALLAFVAFSLCASSAYVLNDLMDLPSDRHHPRKKHRPLASGQISPVRALACVPALLTAGIGIAVLLSPAFLGLLLLYFGLTLGYSLRLKDIAILDVLTLAGLYALRVSAGAAAVSITPSPWLLAFCFFMFLSLAMVKRYAELMAMRTLDGPKAHARAYLLEDSELLASLGGASGYLAVLILALYFSSEVAQRLYPGHSLLWAECVLLLYWISHVWLMAHRAHMDDDPLVFALRDRVSRILIALMGGVLILAMLPAGAFPVFAALEGPR